jgi:hypothetical protein
MLLNTKRTKLKKLPLNHTKTKHMKTVNLVLAAMLFSTAVQAQTYTIGSGKWSDPCSWSDQSVGSIIKAGAVVIITGQVTLTSSLLIEGTLEIEKGATLLSAKDITIAKCGVFVNNGSTVVGRIVNEGSVNNNLFMETTADIENRNSLENYSAVVAGSNFDGLGGNTCGADGRLYVNHTTPQCNSTEPDAGACIISANEIDTK